MDFEKKVDQLAPDQKPDFCIKVNFVRGTPNPQHIFKFAAAYIDALQAVDGMLAQAIDSKIKPVMLLEEIESGSIKIWLKQFIENIDDDALKHLDWKPAVGKYLVKAKHLLLEKVGGVKRLESRELLEQVAADVNRLARETEVLHMPTYRPVTTLEIANSAKALSEAASMLEEGESASLESDSGLATITPGLAISQEQIDTVLAADVIENRTVRILMVRRPDFLGNASWEFRYEKRRFDARIDDDDWLTLFRSGEIDIRPGDALRVEVLERTTYDRFGEVLDEKRTIVRVLKIVRETQAKLPD
jgi:hypothetical protein